MGLSLDASNSVSFNSWIYRDELRTVYSGDCLFRRFSCLLSSFGLGRELLQSLALRSESPVRWDNLCLKDFPVFQVSLTSKWKYFQYKTFNIMLFKGYALIATTKGSRIHNLFCPRCRCCHDIVLLKPFAALSRPKYLRHYVVKKCYSSVNVLF